LSTRKKGKHSRIADQRAARRYRKRNKR